MDKVAANHIIAKGGLYTNPSHIVIQFPKACCFTGHRPENLPYGDNENDERCIAVKTAIGRQIIKLYRVEDGVYQYLSGMARGADFWGVEAALRFNLLADPSKQKQLEIYGVIPFEKQCDRWQMRDQKRYLALLQQMTFSVQMQQPYTPDCYDKSYNSATVMDLMKSISTQAKFRVADFSRCVPRRRKRYSNSILLSMRYSSAVSGERPFTTTR